MRSRPRCRGSTGTAIPTGRRPSCARRSPRLHGVSPDRCSPPTVRTRCCRRSCSPTPGRVAPWRRSSRRTRCTPRSPASSGSRWSRASATPTSRSTRRDAARGRPSTRPHVVFLTSPNNPTGIVEPADRVARAARRSRPGSSSSTRRTPSSPIGRRSIWSTSDAHWSSPARSPRRGAWRRCRLGYVIGPTWFVRALDKVVLPYHLDAAKQIAGRLALRFVDEMDDRVRLIVAERERISDAMRAMPIDVTPSGANFVLFRPRTVPGRGRLAGARRPQRARARLLGLAAARRLPARHGRHARRERRVPRPPSTRS